MNEGRHNVAVVADPFSAEAFRPADFAVRAVPAAAPVEQALVEVLEEGFGLLFVTENLAVQVAGRLRDLQARYDTLITVIPGAGTDLQLGRRMLAALEQTVVGTGGVDGSQQPTASSQ